MSLLCYIIPLTHILTKHYVDVPICSAVTDHLTIWFPEVVAVAVCSNAYEPETLDADGVVMVWVKWISLMAFLAF